MASSSSSSFSQVNTMQLYGATPTAQIQQQQQRLQQQQAQFKQQPARDASEILTYHESIALFSLMGFDPSQCGIMLDGVYASLARHSIQQSNNDEPCASDLIQHANAAIVSAAAASEDGLSKIKALLRADVVEEIVANDHANSTHAALLNGTATQPPAAAVPFTAIKFAILWQRYASARIGIDFTSLASAFELCFPHLLLPTWLWQLALLEPTPSFEDCYHYVMWDFLSTTKAYWLAGGLKYEVIFEGTKQQRNEVMIIPFHERQFLTEANGTLSWFCHAQHESKRDIRAHDLDDLGILLGRSIGWTENASQLLLSESTLKVNNHRIGDFMGNTVFAFVQRLIFTVAGVVGVSWDDIKQRWRVIYSSDQPHEKLLAASDVIDVQKQSLQRQPSRWDQK